jgi:hypothetical protein
MRKLRCPQQAADDLDANDLVTMHCGRDKDGGAGALAMVDFDRQVNRRVIG